MTISLTLKSGWRPQTVSSSLARNVIKKDLRGGRLAEVGLDSDLDAIISYMECRTLFYVDVTMI